MLMGFINELVREVREDNSLKQAYVGEVSGLAQKEISLIEAAKRNVPAEYIRSLGLMTGDLRLVRYMFPNITIESTPRKPRSKPLPPPGDPRQSNQILLNVMQDMVSALKINDQIFNDGMVTESDRTHILRQDALIDKIRELLAQHQRNTAAWREDAERQKK